MTTVRAIRRKVQLRLSDRRVGDALRLRNDADATLQHATRKFLGSEMDFAA